MYTIIQKWGNSQGIRLPKILLDQVGLKEDEKIELIAHKNQIIIKKINDSFLSLDELFKDYDGDYDCREFDWEIDDPSGREVW